MNNLLLDSSSPSTASFSNTSTSGLFFYPFLTTKIVNLVSPRWHSPIFSLLFSLLRSSPFRRNGPGNRSTFCSLYTLACVHTLCVHTCIDFCHFACAMRKTPVIRLIRSTFDTLGSKIQTPLWSHVHSNPPIHICEVGAISTCGQSHAIQSLSLSPVCFFALTNLNRFISLWLMSFFFDCVVCCGWLVWRVTVRYPITFFQAQHASNPFFLLRQTRKRRSRPISPDPLVFDHNLNHF